MHEITFYTVYKFKTEKVFCQNNTDTRWHAGQCLFIAVSINMFRLIHCGVMSVDSYQLSVSKLKGKINHERY